MTEVSHSLSISNSEMLGEERKPLSRAFSALLVASPLAPAISSVSSLDPLGTAQLWYTAFK